MENLISVLVHWIRYTCWDQASTGIVTVPEVEHLEVAVSGQWERMENDAVEVVLVVLV